MFVSCVTNLVDFLSARSFSEAGTKFSDDERNAKTLSIFSSLANSLLVPFAADALVFNLRLTRETFLKAELAAVGMVIEHVHGRSNFTTGRSLETDREDKALHNASLIRERHRLEPHLLCLVISLVLLMNLFVHRGEVLGIHAARN